MKLSTETPAVLVSYGIAAALAGALAYRACLSGHGFGNAPINAIPATAFTFGMMFAIQSVCFQPMPVRAKLACSGGFIAVGVLAHLFGF